MSDSIFKRSSPNQKKKAYLDSGIRYVTIDICILTHEPLSSAECPFPSYFDHLHKYEAVADTHDQENEQFVEYRYRVQCSPTIYKVT